MSDFVRREDVVRVVENMLGTISERVVDEINSLPTYLPLNGVVRCKDCINATETEKSNVLWCNEHNEYVSENGYCSEGWEPEE